MKTRTSTISDEYSKANYPLGAEDSLLPKRIVSEWMICTEARDRETCQVNRLEAHLTRTDRNY